MALAEDIKTRREALGKAIQDAKAAAPAEGANQEAHDKFTRLSQAAAKLGKELQTLVAQQDLEELAKQAEGPLEPELHSTPSGTRVALPPRRADKLLSDAEYQARYGIAREIHAIGVNAYLRAGQVTPTEAKAEAVRAMKEAMKGAGPTERHLHSVVDDGLGGFTVGDDFRAQVIRALPGFSVVRASGARVIQTSKPTVRFPVLNRAATNSTIYTSDLTQGSSNWRGEGATSGGTARTPQNKPTFGNEEIPVHIWQPDPIEITQELLDDTDVDLLGLLADLIGETMGFDTDLAYLRGDGVGLPEGILNSGATAVTIGSAAKYATPDASGNGFSYSGVTTLYTSLPAQYRQRAAWYLNSVSLQRLLSLNTGVTGVDGHPLFPVNSVPGTLLNRPMCFTEFLDNPSTNGNIPLLFGDPSYYVIAERRQLGIVRLIERYAPNVALQPTARIGGQLVLKDAFRLGQTGA